MLPRKKVFCFVFLCKTTYLSLKVVDSGAIFAIVLNLTINVSFSKIPLCHDHHFSILHTISIAWGSSAFSMSASHESKGL